MYTTFDKAIAAFLASVVSMFALWGINIPFISDPGVQVAVVSLITGLVTYLVPNKAPATPTLG